MFRREDQQMNSASSRDHSKVSRRESAAAILKRASSQKRGIGLYHPEPLKENNMNFSNMGRKRPSLFK